MVFSDYRHVLGQNEQHLRYDNVCPHKLVLVIVSIHLRGLDVRQT